LSAGNAVHWHCIVSNLKKGDVSPQEKISADAHGPGYLQTSAHPQVVATIDVMFRKIFVFGGLTSGLLKWILYGSECGYDDFCLFDI